MEVTPGAGVGPFSLGMSLRDALEVLQKLKWEIEIIYSSQTPLLVDIGLKITHFGLLLRFCPLTQRLRLLDISLASKKDSISSQLQYEGRKIPSDPSFLLISDVFGPTFEGRKWTGKSTPFILSYRGLAFVFDQEPKDEHVAISATCMFIFSGGDLRIPLLPPPLHNGEKNSLEIQMSPFRVSFPGKGPSLGWTSSTQEITQLLGAPEEIFEKTVDRMRIHRLESLAKSLEGDLIFNYFSRGLVIVVSKSTHLCSKIVLHGNFPGHPEFNEYERAHFRLQLGPDKFVFPFSQFSEVRESMGSPRRPMIHSSGADAHPFGTTQFFSWPPREEGAPAMVVEVMKSEYISTWTLFPITDRIIEASE